MIQREWQQVTVTTFSNTKDEYGQTRQTVASTRTVDMVCKIYSQSDINNPNFVNITMVGLTKDKAITTENEITISNKVYTVKYVVPSGKYNQILMSNK